MRALPRASETTDSWSSVINVFRREQQAASNDVTNSFLDDDIDFDFRCDWANYCWLVSGGGSWNLKYGSYCVRHHVHHPSCFEFNRKKRLDESWQDFSHTTWILRTMLLTTQVFCITDKDGQVPCHTHSWASRANTVVRRQFRRWDKSYNKGDFIWLDGNHTPPTWNKRGVCMFDSVRMPCTSLKG